MAKSPAPTMMPETVMKMATPGKTRMLASKFLSQLLKALEPGRALKKIKMGAKTTWTMMVTNDSMRIRSTFRRVVKRIIKATNMSSNVPTTWKVAFIWSKKPPKRTVTTLATKVVMPPLEMPRNISFQKIERRLFSVNFWAMTVPTSAPAET